MAPLRAFVAPSVARRWTAALAVAAVLIVAAAAAVVLLTAGGGSRNAAATGGLLPKAENYMSLLALGGNPETILLGTGDEVYASHDGGASWKPDGLEGMIVMNLALGPENDIWAAGHELLAISTNGGASWESVAPAGLPHHDIHTLAVNPSNPETIWAWLAAVPSGLYRSTNGGHSFSPVPTSGVVGSQALAVMPHEELLLARPLGKLLLSTDRGEHWRTVLGPPVADVELDRREPSRVLVARGGSVLLSTDAGKAWKPVLHPAGGAGPVSWSTTDPRVAYAVGLRRTIYRSADGGISWNQVR